MKVRAREWRDENDRSNFPFEDGASLRSDSGMVLLPGTFLDAVLYPAEATGALFLSQVLLRSGSVTLTIGDAEHDNLCTGTFDLQDPPEEIRLVDSYGRSSGLLVSEPLRLAVFQAWSLGTHTFTAEQTPLVAAVSWLQPDPGVQGLLLGDTGAELVAGEVWLVGGDGILLSYREVVEPPGLTRSVIRIDAVGDPLFLRQLCSEPGLFQSPRFLRQLVVQKGPRTHTVLPGGSGDVQITVGSQLAADTVLRISPTATGMIFDTVGEKLQTIT